MRVRESERALELLAASSDLYQVLVPYRTVSLDYRYFIYYQSLDMFGLGGASNNFYTVANWWHYHSPMFDLVFS